MYNIISNHKSSVRPMGKGRERTRDAYTYVIKRGKGEKKERDRERKRGERWRVDASNMQRREPKLGKY